MSVRMKTLALVSAAGLLMSSCSRDNDNATELSFNASTSSVAEKSSSATSESATTKEECSRADMKLEETELQHILETKKSAVSPSARVFKNIRVAEDGYDPCKPFSYVVLEGTVSDQDAKALAIFRDGELTNRYDDFYLSSDSLEVTEIDEGFAFKADETDLFAGIEGDTRAPMLTYSLSRPMLDAMRLDLDKEPYTSPEIKGDEVDLRGETAFEISIKDLKMLCAIDEDTESFECARDDGNQWIWDERPLAIYNPERASVDSLSVFPLDPGTDSFELGMRRDDFQPKRPKKLEEKTYRIGLGDMEGQLIVSEDSVVLGTPHTDYFIFTAETIEKGSYDEMERELPEGNIWPED